MEEATTNNSFVEQSDSDLFDMLNRARIDRNHIMHELAERHPNRYNRYCDYTADKDPMPVDVTDKLYLWFMSHDSHEPIPTFYVDNYWDQNLIHY